MSGKKLQERQGKRAVEMPAAGPQLARVSLNALPERTAAGATTRMRQKKGEASSSS